MPLLETKVIGVDDIYVPVKRRKDLKPETVEAIAESMLEHGQKTPISVRSDGERFVLVEGLHRLEACKALGEATITRSSSPPVNTERHRRRRSPLPADNDLPDNRPDLDQPFSVNKKGMTDFG